MAPTFKRRDFARWQAREKLSDSVLCQAVKELARGLIDANLGGSLYKKRVARPGGAKSGGYRTLLSARIGVRHVFLYGFSKGEQANITQDERKALQYAGRVFLELPHRGQGPAGDPLSLPARTARADRKREAFR